MLALHRLSSTSVFVTLGISRLPLGLLAVMICAESLHVVALVVAAARCADDVIELFAELVAAADSADELLLCEDCDA